MANYPIPQWIQPYGDPGQLYLEAQRQSQSLELAKDKLEAEERMAHMDNQARLAIATQRAREAQQRAEIQKARISAEIGLRSQAIDVQRARVNQAAQQAAQRYAAQQMFSQRIDAGDTAIQAALRTPGLGLTGAGYANLARAGTPQPTIEPTWTMDPNTHKLIPYNARTGEPRPAPLGAHIPEGAMTQQARAQETLLKARLPALDKQLSDPLTKRAERTDEEIAALPKDKQAAAVTARDKARALEDERDQILSRLEKITGLEQGAAGGPTAAPKAGGSLAKRKAARANELAQQHPDWTKDQIMAQVRKEFK